MAVFTVHEPPRRDGDGLTHRERFIFVRDGFCWPAFFFGPLWILRHRLWLAFFGYLLLAAVVVLALRAVAASAALSALIALLVALLLSIEASSLRRFGLARAGWRAVAVVVGDDLEAAERRFFAAWVGSRPAPPKQPPAGGTADSSEVIGLFPQPGVRT